MKQILFRLCSILLCAALLLSPAAALTREQAAELLDGYYIDPVPQRVLDAPTVSAMIAALGDKFTQYFTASQYEAFLNGMKDSAVVGIGVELEACAQGVEILKVLDDSPAQEAGLRRGDKITAVDGRSVAGEGFSEIRARIAGEADTQVTLTVLRDGKSWDEILTRREVTVPATKTELVDGHVAYITCTTFGGETQGHFEDGVTALDAVADRYIVDLRGNGGGDVEAAVEAVGTFTGEADIAYLRNRQGRYQVYRREEGALTLDPVIVLTNSGTASASELFASAVRDMGTGLVIGERTYGKGVAQIVLDGSTLSEYFPDGDAMKITAYRYYSALGTSADRVGIIPHLLIDDAYASQAALLLSASAPKTSTLGMLRVDLKWRWYVDLEEATEKGSREAFGKLLEAIPPGTPLWLGVGGNVEEGWRKTDVAEIARLCSLKDPTRRFSDLASCPWREEIETLHTYGLVEGGGDGTFRPGGTLTRGQLCTMLAKAMKYKPSAAGKDFFADVPERAWYADGVNAMYELGLVNGCPDGLFHPEEPVDHQQLLTILGRIASGLSISFLAASEKGMGEAEADYASWSAWARPYVWLLDGSQSTAGREFTLLWEFASQIEPTAPATRGEAACALYGVLSYTNILPS